MSQYNKLTEDEKQLWKQAIVLALEALVKNGWEARKNSKKFDVLYNEHRIPPKEVIAYVFEHFDKHNIETSIERVAGGEKDTNNLLRDLGLIILPKKRNLKEYLKEIDVWSDWRTSYREFVPLFMQEAVTGKDWEEWDSKNFYEFFEKSNDQCVSSLKQGYFTSVEKSEIKRNWNKISPLLKDIIDSTESPSFVKYIELKNTIRRYTSQDRRAATNRLIASIQPNFLCTIVNQENLNTLISYLNKFVLNADFKTQSNWFENSHAVHSFFLKEGDFKDAYEMITYPWQLFEYFNGNHHLNDNDMSENKINNEIINLLKYKKQIILQGPPGTGKTREAKEMAKTLLDDSLDKKNINSKNLNDDFLSKIFNLNDEIQSSNRSTKYIIIEVRKNSIVVSGESRNSSDTITFVKLRDCINYPEQFPLGTGLNSQYRAAANFVNEILKNNSKISAKKISLQDNDQFKLIQFHPSYTYEDFVRGIIAESKDNQVKYTNVNKVLGEFAEKSLKNFKASTTNAPESSINEWIDEKFEDFKNNIQAKLPEEETKLSGDTITIFEVRDDHFKYAKNWQTPGYLKFSEFKNLVRAILQDEIKLTSAASDLDKDKFLHAHYLYTYYNALLVHFFGIYKYEEKKKEIIDTKNYVLLIDEINRANLSSVLGELIYALEYRGDAVDSMYAVEDSILLDKNKLILPPNLYIIGTMNTADRSVGHIDYAIRRRFAFVDVLPKNLTSELGNRFELAKFAKVASLFVKDYNSEIDYNDDATVIERSEHLTHDFDPKDVWLGHSYFIQQYEKDEHGKDIKDKPIDFNLRIKYEIKPVLEEYIKDGILKESARAVINSL